LDHWGFKKEDGEDFEQMYRRIHPDKLPEDKKGTLANWIESKHNGFYDNSIEGVAKLNEFAAKPPENIYVFTMSFQATVPFPNINLTQDEIDTFPINLAGVFRHVRMITFIPMRFLGSFTTSFVNASFDTLVDQRELPIWATKVANNHLKSDFGYPFKLPEPGSQVPRHDMIPVMSPTAYGMAGYKRTMRSDADWQRNDGIVNTVSMNGPAEEYVVKVKEFPDRVLAKEEIEQRKGRYLHFSDNMTLDHADEVGIFFDNDKVSYVTFLTERSLHADEDFPAVS
jgi:hypothetical protein